MEALLKLTFPTNDADAHITHPKHPSSAAVCERKKSAKFQRAKYTTNEGFVS